MVACPVTVIRNKEGKIAMSDAFWMAFFGAIVTIASTYLKYLNDKWMLDKQTKTVEDKIEQTGGKVAQVVVGKSEQTSSAIAEVHKAVNGGPEGLEVKLMQRMREIALEAAKEVASQLIERTAAGVERKAAAADRAHRADTTVAPESKQT